MRAEPRHSSTNESGEHWNRNLGPVRTSMVHIVDWFPTLLSLAGHQLEEETDGLDIWRTLTGDEELRTSFVYNIDIEERTDTFQLAVRRREYKLIWGQPSLDKV